MTNKKPAQTSGGIEAGGEQPVRQPDKRKPKEAALTLKEKEKLARYIQSAIETYDFSNLLKKENFNISDSEGKEVNEMILKAMGIAQDDLIGFLVKEYGAEGLKKDILAGRYPEIEYFESELKKIAEEYYLKFLNGAEAINKRQSEDFNRLNLGKYPDAALDAAAEALREGTEQEELEEKIRSEIEKRVGEVISSIEGLDKENLKKSGVDLEKLEAETQAFLKDEEKEIVRHCLSRFQKGSEHKMQVRDPEQISLWTNYFTDSAFEHKGGEELRKAYLKAFPKSAGGTRTINEDTWSGPIDPKDTSPAREIMRHALASPNLKNLSDLVGSGEKIFDTEAGREAFNRKINELLDDFTTHGMLGKPDPKTGERPLLPKSDLDGQACIILLKKAGFDLSKIKYVRQGEEPESGWTFDTTKEHGYVARDGGKILITNDSNKESGKDSSAKFIFDGLVKFGLLDAKKHPGIRKFVEFVTKEDNKDYTDEEAKQIIAHYSKNLMGLRRFLTDEALVRIFEEKTMESSDFSPYRELPISYLENLEKQGAYINSLSYKDVSKRLTDSKKYSLGAIENLAEQGFAIDTGKRFGRVLIDTGQKDAQGIRKRKVGLGFDAARHEGYGAYVVFDEEGGYFSIQTVKEMDFDFPQGFAVGKRYWLFTGNGEELKITLEEVLRKLDGNPDYKMPDGLKEILEKEKQENEEIEKRVDSLFKGLKIDEIERGLPENVSVLPDDEKKKVEEKSRILREAKVLIRKMAGAFSSEDFTFFLESIFEEKYLEYYKKTRDQETDPAKPQGFEDKFKRTLRDYLEENGYNKEEIKQIVNLFGKISELKFG
ncbi:MAG: hypothetical protein PHP25_02995 [Candidatus Moranbacteria bacterium]|nr:hypothetical protein [Candidatus Moranbacteria bacterium]